MNELEQKDYLECIFDHLPPCEVELLKLRYYDDRTYKDIGKKFKVTGTAARVSIDKILISCRTIVSGIDKGRDVITEPSLSANSNFSDGKLTDAQVAIRKKMDEIRDRTESKGEKRQRIERKDVKRRRAKSRARKGRRRRSIAAKQAARFRREVDRLAKKKREEEFLANLEWAKEEDRKFRENNYPKDFIGADGYRYTIWVPKDKNMPFDIPEPYRRGFIPPARSLKGISHNPVRQNGNC
jgi:hypothetical protein